MAEKKLECAKCGRKFALPAHLARHTNSAHGTGSRRRRAKKVRRRPVAKPTAGRTTASLGSVSATSAIRELRALHRQLCAQRADLADAIEGVEAALSTIGGGSAPRGRRKRRR